MKKIILFFLSCMLSFSLHAQNHYDFVEPNADGIRIYYNIIDAANHYVEVTNNYNADSYKTQLTTLQLHKFTIPATVEHAGVTYQVKAIGNNGIGNSAPVVNGTYSYVDIELPEGLTTIKKGAFYALYTLRKINFPSTLTSIEENAFGAAGSWGKEQTPSFYQTYDLSHTQITELNNVFRLQFSIEKIIYPETLKILKGSSTGGAVSYDSPAFTSVTIPSAVEMVGVFEGQNLNTIYMQPTVAPAFEQGAGGNLKIKNTVTIYVPIDATFNYETATGAATPWQAYKGQYREQVKIGPHGYTSFYLENENFEVPAGCTAYIIKSVTQEGTTNFGRTTEQVIPAGSVIPKQTGFILKGTAGSTVTYRANLTGVTEVNVTGNLLVGTATEQEISGAGYKYYLFGHGAVGQGFYYQTGRDGNSIKLPAHRAGLKLSTLGFAPAKELIFNFEDATTNGISTVEQTAEPRTDVIYDLQGRRVKNPVNGIYIVNGRKVVISK